MKECLVISGGGIYGSLFLGVLQFLKESGRLNEITHYVGSSIGGMLVCLLACGFDTKDLYKNMLHVEKYNTCQDIDIGNLFINCGISTGNSIFEYIRDIIGTKHNGDITFQELYKKTGKQVTVTSVNVNSMQLEFINHKTFPNIPVWKAIELTCNVPILFTLKEYNGNKYIDGSFSNNFPIDYALNVYGFKIDQIYGICKTAKLDALKNNDFFAYIQRLIHIILFTNHHHEPSSQTLNILNVHLDKPFNENILEMNIDTLIELYDYGYEFIKKELINT
jgi:predicted patatin/cPLA2 family phospholipase